MKILKTLIGTILVLSALFTMAGCGPDSHDYEAWEPGLGSQAFPLSSIISIADSLSSEILFISEYENEGYPDKDDLEFGDLAAWEFFHGSGAGGWGETLKIYPDGSFCGSSFNSNLWETGEDYPFGTYYTCEYTGRFTPLIKTGEFEYSMRCEASAAEVLIEQEEIKDGTRIVSYGVSGIQSGDEFILYLPGKRLNVLPEEFLVWVNEKKTPPQKMHSEGVYVLSYYGLYNPINEKGYKGYVKAPDAKEDAMKNLDPEKALYTLIKGK